MAFVDELKIKAKAGDGGDGVVRWRHEKFREFGGPSGGDGGRGGDVYALAVRDVHLLGKYRTKKDFKAEDGENGGKNSLHGANGEDLDIELPIGSIVTDLRDGKQVRLNEEGERVLLLKGGSGGRGNESFKSSKNTRPEESTPGKPGEEAVFDIEVELIADIGLIGFPSAGKTSLLNSLTNAHGKVGDYPFTTLEPALGECFGYIIADIPGLIEGASHGKGLGHKFLRHIRRTKMLVHLVSLEEGDPLDAYEKIRDELGDFDPALLEKKELVVLTKTDLAESEGEVKEKLEKLKTANTRITSVTLYDDQSVKELREYILGEIEKD